MTIGEEALSLRRVYRGKRTLPYNIYLLASGLILLTLTAAIFLFVPYARFLAQLLGGLGIVLLICYLLGTLPSFAPFGTIVRKIRVILLLSLAVWFVSFVAVESLIIIDSKTSENSNAADYLVVLGAGLYGSTPSPSLKSRLDEALVYADKNLETIIIVSGGQGGNESITESLAMYTYLVNHGVDDSRIIREDMSASTQENIRFSFDIITNHWLAATSPKIAILSNEYHLFRARLIAGREGHDVKLVAAETPMFSLKIAYYAREYFALLKFFVFV